MSTHGWKRLPLGELIRIKHGFAFKGQHFLHHGDELVLTPGNFRIGGGMQTRDGKERYYTGPYPAEFRLQRGDLLVAMTDLTQSAPILGSPLVVPGDGAYLHNQRLGKVQILDEGKLDPGFAYFLFVSDCIRSQLRGSATGSTVRHTAPERIYSATLHLPPLPIQRKIAAILSAYDAFIDNNSQRVSLLEEMAQRIYREWFVEWRYPGHETATLVESKVGPIPDGWSVAALGSLVSQSRASINPVLFPEEVFEHFSIPAFDADGCPTLDAGSSIKSSKFAVDSACVLYCKLNPRIPRVWLVEPSAGRRAVASTELLPLTPKAHWNLPLLHGLLSSPEFANRVTGMAGGTSTSHQRIKPGDLLTIPVVDPTTKMATLFGEVGGRLLALAAYLRSAQYLLRSTRDFLLPRLVLGEIDVESLNIAAPDLAV